MWEVSCPRLSCAGVCLEEDGQGRTGDIQRGMGGACERAGTGQAACSSAHIRGLVTCRPPAEVTGYMGLQTSVTLCRLLDASHQLTHWTVV